MAKVKDDCGDTMDQHIIDVMGALADSPLGFGCEKTYQALVEATEYIRLGANLPVYTPTGKVVNVLAQLMAEHGPLGIAN